ncbi:MAG: winged helix-turn-helix transcriptional regulator [Rhodospirillales bacterium]|nr:winged helix-turn-helix transcriptional regulator [Rhodospirillales bacterium]
MNVEALHVSARRASALLKAMGNPHRLMILCQLVHGERSVGELERIVGLSQSALSQHLARLRRDSLVKTRRSAQTIFYSLAGSEASMIMATLYEIYCAGGQVNGVSPMSPVEDYSTPSIHRASLR